jgi:hypothetical protein
VWIVFTWVMIGTGGVLSWIRWWTFGFWRHGVRVPVGKLLWSVKRVVYFGVTRRRIYSYK